MAWGARNLISTQIFYVLAGVSSNPAVWFALYAVLVASFLTFQSIGLMFSAGVSGENVVTVAMIYVTYVFLFTGLIRTGVADGRAVGRLREPADLHPQALGGRHLRHRPAQVQVRQSRRRHALP